MNSNRKTARLAGFWYLIYILMTVIASSIRSRIIGGDAAAATLKILSSEGLFRFGFILDILSAVFFLLAAWSLYVLLKPVNRDLALLFLILNLGGVVIQCINSFNLLAALLILKDPGFLKAFQADQLQALSMGFIHFYNTEFIIAQAFFSSWLIPLGYLVYDSGFLPRVLGVLLMLDFLGVLIWFFQFFLFPDYKAISYPGLVVSFIAEAGLTLWLLIKGAKDPKPAGSEAS